MALANIGVLLAKRGKRVLLMDWDLEAPGLDQAISAHTSRKDSLPTGELSTCSTKQLPTQQRTGVLMFKR